MRLFNLSEKVTKDLNEVQWKYRLHVKDIFKSFQAKKVSLKQAKSMIINRITKFVDSSDSLPDDAKESLNDFKKTLNAESDIDIIDQLIGISFFDIADAHNILVK